MLGWSNRWMVRWTNGQAGRIDRRLDGQMDKWTNGQAGRQAGRDGQEKSMNTCRLNQKGKEREMGGQIDGQLDQQMDRHRWMDGIKVRTQ